MDAPAHCPHCRSDKRQTKAGRTATGSARFHCVACDKDYTPQPKAQGYDASTRQQALVLVLEGLSLRAAARIVGVNAQSVANWLVAHQVQLQSQLQSRGETSLPPVGTVAADTVELDEVHVFVGARKGEKNAGST